MVAIMSQHDDVVTLSRGPELGLGMMISGCLWLIRSKHGQGLSFFICVARDVWLLEWLLEFSASAQGSPLQTSSDSNLESGRRRTELR